MQIPLLVLVLCVLVPVSGLIAWAGDRIGHVVGKRRHTFLGMRPRHTAMFFTIGSGVGISLVSFLVLFFSSEGFRVVLEKGVELLTINKTLRKENDALQTEVQARATQVDAARTETVAALTERDTAQKRRDETLRQNAAVAKQYAAAKTELKGAQAGLRDAEAGVTRVETAYNETKAKLGASAARLSEVGEKLAGEKRRLRDAHARLTTAQTRVLTATQAASVAKVALTKAVADKAKVEANAERVVKDLGTLAQEQKRKAEAERTALQTEVAAKQAELKRLSDELTTMQARRTELAAQLGASLSRTTALRRGQITYRVGEEIARASIASDQSVWRIESALEQFWKGAARTAQERGATATGSGSRAVVIAPLALTPTQAPTPDTGAVANASLPSEDEVLRTLAQTIRRSTEPVAVVLRASTNAVVGEPVLVEIRTYRNPVVLEGGVKLGETSIKATPDMTREAATDALYEFLRRDIRKVLLSAGVIPEASGDMEDGASVVRLSGAEWLKIMDDLKRADYNARVIVKTAKPLRAADPVSLVFEVKEIPRYNPPQVALP